MATCRNNHLHILREPLRKPEGNIGLFSSLLIGKSVNSLNNYHNFMVNLLSAVYDLLFFHFRADYIKPVCKEFSDVFLKQIYILFKFQSLLKFCDYLVKGVKIVAVVAASTCEVHNREDLLFLCVVVKPNSFLPLAKDTFHSAARLGLKDQWPFAIFFEPAVDLMNMFFLSGPYLFRLIMIQDSLAGAE